MSLGVLIRQTGAAGRPFLSVLADHIIQKLKAEGTYHYTKMNTSSRSPIDVPAAKEDKSENAIPTTAASDRDALKLNMLRRIRPAPLKYAWAFYHDKNSTSGDYEGRLTVMLENIVTIKPFWEMMNQFPFENLRLRDSVHFFKRGVKPVWEDPRNINGGSWTFRVPKAQSHDFWKETLLLAVGEQFADVIEPRKLPFSPPSSNHTPPPPKKLTPNSLPGDDLCGITLSVRFNSDLISIWTRDGTNQKTIDGILSVMLAKLSPHLTPKESSNYYYKKHSEHKGFNEVVASAKLAEAPKEKEGEGENPGKILEAEVRKEESEKALLKEKEAEEDDGK